MKYRILLLCLLLLGCQKGPPPAAPTPGASSSPVPFQEILDSEELLWQLAPTVSKLSRDLKNLDPELSNFGPHLSDQVTLNSPLPATGQEEWQDHSLAESQSVKGQRVRFWPELLPTLDSFDWLGLSTARGRFLNPERTLWEGIYYLNALGRTGQGKSQALQGTLRIVWRRTSQEWKASELVLLQLRSMSASEPYFSDETRAAIPQEEIYARVRDSVGERLISDYLDHPEDPEKAARVLNPHSDLAMAFHPSVSVVDLNQDGWDDLYLCRRYENSSALINQRDGTFLDRTEELGLSVRGDTTCALFADFDNDGDQDLFLGRYYSPGQYLENQGGTWKRMETAGPFPEGVTSASAADINGDGLLDLFAAVYVPFPYGYPLEKAREFHLQAASSRGQELELNRATVFPFSERPDETLRSLLQSPDNHIFASRYSNPSAIFLNQGGGFVRQETPAELYSNCMHGAFADLDQDGDPDLLSANPNGPNALLLNEGGKFRSSPDKSLMGNAMGAAWGDYDGDGDLDPYLSIMYSKANLRIGLKEHHRFTPGNVLYRNDQGRFTQSSGEDKLKVHKAGWSWGSQFADFNNDGRLDIYALSGFYSAPARFALPVDQ